MNFSISLDYFGTKTYNIYEVNKLKRFMEYNFDINKIVLACFVPPNGGAPVHKNRSSHGLAFHPDGEREYVFQNMKILAKANDVVYLPKGSNYQVKKISPGACFAINFDTPEPLPFSPFVFKIKGANKFLDCFKSAELVWRTKTSGFEMKCKSELYNIIYHLRKEFELGYISKKYIESIKPAIDYIHMEYTNENISIPHLAQICNMSETYFRRLFKKACGTSPLQYINNLKITRAKEFLASGVYSVSEISELSGFHDESYFSREFKKATGMCPSEYES